MDRTNLVAIMAALTAGSIVTFEYLRWSHSRQKPQAMPVATTTAETPGATTHTDKRDESDQESQTDLSANWPSMLSRNKEDRNLLGAKLIKSEFYVHCSCDEHAKQLYFNWPYSCKIKHNEDDVVVQAGSRPTLLYEFGNAQYEGLSLANRTIEYFSRPQDDMDSKQIDALNQWRLCSERVRVLEMLAREDIRGKETDFLTHWLVVQLNELFFFSAIKNLETVWNRKELDELRGRYGDAEIRFKDGHDHSIIRLHPTRRCYIKPEYTRKGKTLAEERMGCILHELLHVFLMQFVCELCIAWENCIDHGRVWKRIAKAIEEQSLRLLGIEVDIGRLDSFLADSEDYHEPRHSLHDLEAWGFWERMNG